MSYAYMSKLALTIAKSKKCFKLQIKKKKKIINQPFKRTRYHTEWINGETSPEQLTITKVRIQTAVTLKLSQRIIKPRHYMNTKASNRIILRQIFSEIPT